MSRKHGHIRPDFKSPTRFSLDIYGKNSQWETTHPNLTKREARKLKDKLRKRK